jgi:hypothetical protein
LYAIEQDYQIAFVETSENAVNIAFALNAYFEEPFYTFNAFKKPCGNAVQDGYHKENFIHLFFGVIRKPFEKILEKLFVKNNLTDCFHRAKLMNCVTFCKRPNIFLRNKGTSRKNKIVYQPSGKERLIHGRYGSEGVCVTGR